jgi:hypothetical protein
VFLRLTIPFAFAPLLNRTKINKIPQSHIAPREFALKLWWPPIATKQTHFNYAVAVSLGRLNATPSHQK